MLTAYNTSPGRGHEAPGEVVFSYINDRPSMSFFSFFFLCLNRDDILEYG